jgi:DNA-binding FadR family transcriptional regulator
VEGVEPAPAPAPAPAASAGTSAIDVVSAALECRILTGELPAGARLPAERDLARDFATSRATVAKATGRLADRGMVSARHGSGVEVLAWTAWSPDVIPRAVALADDSQRTEMVGDLFGIMRGLFADAARRSARTLAPGDLDVARAARDRAWTARNDPAAWRDADRDQARLVLEALGLRASIWVANDLEGVYMALAASVDTIRRVPRDYRSTHERYYTLLEANEHDAAADLLGRYLDREERRLRRALHGTTRP